MGQISQLSDRRSRRDRVDGLELRSASLRCEREKRASTVTPISIGSELSNHLLGAQAARLLSAIGANTVRLLEQSCRPCRLRSQLYRRLIGSCSSAFDIGNYKANHAIVDALRQGVAQRAQEFC